MLKHNLGTRPTKSDRNTHQRQGEPAGCHFILGWGCATEWLDSPASFTGLAHSTAFFAQCQGTNERGTTVGESTATVTTLAPPAPPSTTVESSDGWWRLVVTQTSNTTIAVTPQTRSNPIGYGVEIYISWPGGNHPLLSFMATSNSYPNWGNVTSTTLWSNPPWTYTVPANALVTVQLSAAGRTITAPLQLITIWN